MTEASEQRRCITRGDLLERGAQLTAPVRCREQRADDLMAQVERSADSGD